MNKSSAIIVSSVNGGKYKVEGVRDFDSHSAAQDFCIAYNRIREPLNTEALTIKALIHSN